MGRDREGENERGIQKERETYRQAVIHGEGEKDRGK